MNKKDSRFYVCVHEGCSFKTDKRKAIYTHLVRTHSERKEDFECEYCSTVFAREELMEEHLHVAHPQQPFTYTCVSRIENVIHSCAKMGSQAHDSVETTSAKPDIVAEIKDRKQSVVSRPVTKAEDALRTKLSVNESLTKMAKRVQSQQITTSDYNERNSDLNHSESDTEEEDYEGCEDESPTYTSKPSGLKIKFSLKKENSDNEDPERSTSPPMLLPHVVASPGSAHGQDSAPPDIVHGTVNNAQVRDKSSKYYDKLEVYHSTDELGRRCCPFCDYKTTKNTIRVHLSGIHKIHFVKCSLCDYKAAFPHQITQHGIKFHKTTNLNVIQLTKEYRERIISNLKQLRPTDSANAGSDDGSDDIETHASVEDEYFHSEDSNSSTCDSPTPRKSTPTSAFRGDGRVDERVFKAPVCQTSKTDYYTIQYEKGVYLYSCRLCPFQTPVRATIYTHKYRHEEKSYMCGYCDFTAAPRYASVAHKLNVVTKNTSILVTFYDKNI